MMVQTSMLTAIWQRTATSNQHQSANKDDEDDEDDEDDDDKYCHPFTKRQHLFMPCCKSRTADDERGEIGSINVLRR